MLVEWVIVARVFLSLSLRSRFALASLSLRSRFALTSLSRQTTPVHKSPASRPCIEMYYFDTTHVKCYFSARLKPQACDKVVFYARSVKNINLLKMLALCTDKEMIRGAGPGFGSNCRRYFFMTNNETRVLGFL